MLTEELAICSAAHIKLHTWNFFFPSFFFFPLSLPLTEGLPRSRNAQNPFSQMLFLSIFPYQLFLPPQDLHFHSTASLNLLALLPQDLYDCPRQSLGFFTSWYQRKGSFHSIAQMYQAHLPLDDIIWQPVDTASRQTKENVAWTQGHCWC